eukprot:TRINITY_DN5548_c0_g3_i2.p1 TRINITY_DN5548_c0_g3~~TRINITY_DN5548_c0_g3_i2.p1  ORF type:complete len:1380 (+),score=242.43 TRINITY_DN5548_c0_g3_i2:33-4172(+)
MDLAKEKELIEKASQEVLSGGSHTRDGRLLLRCLVGLLKRPVGGKASDEREGCLLALKAIKIMMSGCFHVSYTGDYHLERLIASLLRRMQDSKGFTKHPNTILETATLGLQVCEATARTKFDKREMTPSGLPQQFTVLVNNLLSARSKVLSEVTEELYEEITSKSPNPILNALLPKTYKDAWHSNVKTIISTKEWIEYHWSQDKSQALYYRVTLARALLTLGKCSPTAEDAVQPVRDGLYQITLLGSGRFRNVAFAANVAQTFFVNAYTLLRSRQDMMYNQTQKYSSPGTPFNCLKEVSDSQFLCFAEIAAAEEVVTLPRQIYIYSVMALACWDALVGSGISLSSSAEKNIEYLSKALLYQGDDNLHLWASNLIHANGKKDSKISAGLQICSTLLNSGATLASKIWSGECAKVAEGVQAIQCKLLHPDTTSESLLDLLRQLVDVTNDEDGDLQSYEIELLGRTILSKTALSQGCSEAAVAAGECYLAGFFRTDPLILAETRKQSTSIIHKIFSLLHAHTEALLTRGENTSLMKLLSQAIKVQGCNGGSFSAYHTAGIMCRLGESKATTHRHSEALKCYAAAQSLLSLLLGNESCLDLKIRIAMLSVDSQVAMGLVGEAMNELDVIESTLIEKMKPSNLSNILSSPWQNLLGSLNLTPIAHVSDLGLDLCQKYESLKALFHSKKAMCQATQNPKITLTKSIPNLTDPRDAAHARIALATLDVNTHRESDSNLQWFEKSPTQSSKETLKQALDTGSLKGPAMSTRKCALELVRKYGTDDQLQSSHYLNVSQGWTTRHQYHGLCARRSIDVFNFSGDWYAEQGRLDSHLTNAEAYIDRLQAFLPPSFAVVTLSIGANGHLLISRIESGMPPLCVGLADSEERLQNMQRELDSILARAKEHVTSVDKDQIDNRKYKQKWWDQRVGFDKEVKNCIASIGDNVLGVWRGLLLGQPVGVEHQQKLAEITNKAVASLRALLPANHHIDERMVRLLLSSAPHLHEGLKCDAVKRKGGYWRETTHMLYEGFQDVIADESLLTPDLKSQLKQIVRSVHEQLYSVIPTGKRCNRQHVLLVLGSLHKLPWEATSALEGEPASRIPSLDYLVQKLETEALSDMLCRPIDSSKTFFVLNPDGNLKKTEAKFDWFKKREGWKGQVGSLPGTVQNGAGIGSRAPGNPESEKQWREKWLKIFTYGLMRTDVFLFLGHGTGDQFVGMKDVRSIGYSQGTGVATPIFSQPPPLSPAAGTPVRKLFDDPTGFDFGRRSNSPLTRRRRSVSTTAVNKKSICLLMGCSSGKLSEAAGEFEPDGMPFSFLLAGAPAVLANLWDVTDGEIDRFTESLLKNWLDKDPSSTPFTKAINASRDSVKLRYLIGACPILYGLPINPSLE